MFKMVDYVSILGYAAGILIVVAYVPQVIKIWKTKSARDLSLYLFIILLAGTFLWTVYGFLVNSMPIILANVSIFSLSIIILYFKLKYK